jgi:hypothetical protein
MTIVGRGPGVAGRASRYVRGAPPTANSIVSAAVVPEIAKASQAVAKIIRSTTSLK